MGFPKTFRLDVNGGSLNAPETFEKTGGASDGEKTIAHYTSNKNTRITLTVENEQSESDNEQPDEAWRESYSATKTFIRENGWDDEIALNKSHDTLIAFVEDKLA